MTDEYQGRTSMIDKNQVAHDLAMAYINNRYGAEVSGEFSVETWNDEVSGSGTVRTERLPGVDKVHMIRVGNGEKYFFGLRERTELVESGQGYEVDSISERMIEDYYNAFTRFHVLLERR
jgi:hypothetical protein